MTRNLALTILTAILLAEAILSRAITGAATLQAVLLAVMGLFLFLRWVLPPKVERGLALVGAGGLAVGGWYAMEHGAIPIVLSELPWGFYLAMGAHFWIWAGRLSARRRSPAWERIMGLFAGGVILWTLGNVEIYGASELGMRFLGVLILVGSGVVSAAGEGSASELRRAKTGGGTLVVKSGPRQKQSGWGRWKVRGTAGLAVLGLVFLLAWSMALGDRLAGQCYRWLEVDDIATTLGDQEGDQAVVVASGGFNDEAMLQLPKRADLSLSDQFQFGILFDDDAMFRRTTQEVIYLRTSALVSFSEGGLMGPRRQGFWIYDSDDGVEDGVTQLGEGIPASDPPLSYWTLVDRTEAKALPLMAGAEAVGVSGIYVFADDWYQLALRADQAQVRYEVRARQRVWEQLIAEGALEKGDAPIEYLQLPGGPLTEKILSVVREVAPREKNTPERIEGIRRYLQENCRYSLRYENPDDLSPVENFLFAERRGHCELYAAATVMMARAIGVPARVAFGYSGGQSDSARRAVAFRQSDYHAWAELFLEDHGWVILDTTPDGMGAASTATEDPQSIALAPLSLEDYENLGSERLLGQVEVPWYSQWSSALVDWVAEWFLGICGLAGLIAGWRTWRRSRKRRSAAGSSHGEGAGVPGLPAMGAASSAPNLLERYLERCREQGYEKRPGQTLAEHLAWMKGQEACGSELDELNHYFYRWLYVVPETTDDRSREDSLRRLVEALSLHRSGQNSEASTGRSR